MEMKLYVTVALAIIGWWLGHYLSQRKDRKNRKHDIRTDYLRNTYNELSRLRSYSKVWDIKEVGESLIKVLSNIELYGSEEQIVLVKSMADEITKDGRLPSINCLINDLRDDLRKELGLGKIEGDVTMFLLDYSHSV